VHVHLAYILLTSCFQAGGVEQAAAMLSVQEYLAQRDAGYWEAANDLAAFPD